MADKFLKWHWPMLSYCPDCNCQFWKETGRKVRIQFRKCVQCGHTYQQGADAKEMDNGGQVSFLVLL